MYIDKPLPNKHFSKSRKNIVPTCNSYKPIKNMLCRHAYYDISLFAYAQSNMLKAG